MKFLSFQLFFFASSLSGNMSLTIFDNSPQMLNGKLFFTTNTAKFCFRINKFIALFWSLYHKAGYLLISFFGCNALFTILGCGVFRYVVLFSWSYANAYFARIAFSVFIPFMTSTYEKIILLPNMLVLAAVLLFFTFTRLFLQLSLTISLAFTNTNSFSDRRH